MVASLEIPAFKQAMRERYKAIIIDEFQDTDAMQWQILSTIASEEKTQLFLVCADPKQSIYSFRGADLHTLVEAKAHFNNHFVLSTNYRSSSSLIDKLNSFFDPKTIPGLFTFTNEDDSLTYRTISSGKREVDFFKHHEEPLEFLLFEGTKGRNRSWPSQEIEENKIFPYICSEIKRLKRDHALPFSSFTILVKDRYQSTRLKKFMSENNIPTASISSMPIVETKLFKFLEVAIRLTYTPRCKNTINQFLASDIIGWPRGDFVDLDLDNPLVTNIVDKFTELKDILHKNGVATFIGKLVDTTFTDTPLITKIAASLDDYSDLNQLTTMLINYTKRPIYEFFKDCKNIDPEESVMLRRHPINDCKNSVTIMSSHMSKGLEFDILFSLGTGTRQTTKNLVTTQTEEQDKEKLRLLYVAMTRAKQKLYMVYTIDNDNKPLKPGEGSPLDLALARLSPTPLSYEETYAKIPTLTIDEISGKLKKIGIHTTTIYNVTQLPEHEAEKHPELTPPTSLSVSDRRTFYTSFSSMEFSPEVAPKEKPTTLESTIPELAIPPWSKDRKPFSSSFGEND